MNSTVENTLPERWEVKSLADIGSFYRGVSYKKPQLLDGYREGCITLLRANNIQNGLFLENCQYLPSGFVKNEKLTKKGDVLIAMSSGSKNLVGKNVILPSLSNYSFGAFCSVFRLDEVEQSSFVSLYFQSHYYKEIISNLFRGAGINNLRTSDLEGVYIPIPPLEEQKRIVAKIDALFAKIDKAISLTEESLKQAKNLLPRIIDETFDSFDAEKVDLKSVSDSIQYGYTGKTIESGKYYYLRITDIQGGKVNYQSTPYSDINGIDIEKYILNKGDILFARTGATAGKSYLFNDEVEAVFASYLIRVVCKQDIVKPSFVKWFFHSTNYWKQIFGNIVGAAQPNFNGKKLGELNLKIPSIEQQELVVGYLEKVSKQTNQTQLKLEGQLAYLKQLKSSILSKAFKGEL